MPGADGPPVSTHPPHTHTHTHKHTHTLTQTQTHTLTKTYSHSLQPDEKVSSTGGPGKVSGGMWERGGGGGG